MPKTAPERDRERPNETEVSSPCCASTEHQRDEANHHTCYSVLHTCSVRRVQLGSAPCRTRASRADVHATKAGPSDRAPMPNRTKHTILIPMVSCVGSQPHNGGTVRAVAHTNATGSEVHPWRPFLVTAPRRPHTRPQILREMHAVTLSSAFRSPEEGCETRGRLRAGAKHGGTRTFLICEALLFPALTFTTFHLVPLVPNSVTRFSQLQ